MRVSRVTFRGAYHHITSRAFEGRNIFKSDINKKFILHLIFENAKIFNINILAYCIMDNHYHLILQNTSNRMKDFMRVVNGTFASYYRFKDNSKGYVFQDRYHSRLIQNLEYLKMAITYVLLNPLRAHLIQNPFDYAYSSIGEYYKKEASIVNRDEVIMLFEGSTNLTEWIEDWKNRELPIIKIKSTEIIGDSKGENLIKCNFERRKKTENKNANMRNESGFIEPKALIKEIEKKYGIRYNILVEYAKKNTGILNELLINLRESAGLPFKEINKIKPYNNMKYKSLINRYERVKKEYGKVYSVPRRGKKKRGMGGVGASNVQKEKK